MIVGVIMSKKLLSQHDYQVILSTVEDIYSVQHIEQFPDHILSIVKKAIPCDLASYNEVNPELTRITSASDPVGVTSEPEVQGVLQQYLHEHPLVNYYARTGDGKSIRLSDFLTQRQFHELGLYNEFYRPLNLDYQMTASIVVGQRSLIGIAISRKWPDFSEKERLMLDLLHPHFVRAYRNIHSINFIQRDAGESVKELVVINRLGQVQFFSDRVWQMLHMYFGSFRFFGTLPTELNAWLTRARDYLSHDSDVPIPSVPLEVYKDDKRLTISLIWGGKAATQDTLLFEEEPIDQTTSILAYSRLTPRENEILALISKGKTNREISQTLSLSSRTVKKHLEHIYTKLGVHTRGAAVARFLQL